MRRLHCVFALLLAVHVGPAVSQTPVRQKSFEFDRAAIGNFELTAETELDWGSNAPMTSNIACYGSNQNIGFIIGERGTVERLSIAFLGDPMKDGNRQQIALIGDELWLFVDEKRYEFRNIPSPDRRLSNYTYPKRTEPEIVLPVWHGYAAVRMSKAAPYMDISRIYGDILRARKLEWAFKSRNWDQVDRTERENALPDGWRTRRYSVDNRSLKAAVNWCTQTVASDKARRFPLKIEGAEK